MTKSKTPIKSQGNTLPVRGTTKMRDSFEKSLAILDKVPPDVMIKITETIFDIAKANKTMEGKQQEFEHQLTLIREGNFDRKERATMLVQLLKDMDLPEPAQIKLIDSICKIAEG